VIRTREDRERRLEFVEVTEPQELAKARAMQERADRNFRWYADHIREIATDANRGKFVCIAGQEMFLAEDPVTASDLATAAHPEDDGYFVEYIPKEKVVRVYANQWLLVHRSGWGRSAGDHR